MKILAGKWAPATKWRPQSWVVLLDGPGVEALKIGDRVVIPFVARPEEYWASMEVIAEGYFPVCRLSGLHDGVSVAGLIGEEVVRLNHFE